MAKKKVEEKKEVKFSKYLPGESKWLGRKNKTRQDQMSQGNRDRVHEWDRVRSYSMEHKPRKSSDWLKFRAH